MKLKITYANNFGEWEETITVEEGRADKPAYRHLQTSDVAGLERLSKVDHLCWVDLARECRRWARQWSGPVEIWQDGQKMPEEFFWLRRPPVEAKGDPRIPASGLVDNITATKLFCEYGLGHKSEYSYFKKVG